MIGNKRCFIRKIPIAARITIDNRRHSRRVPRWSRLGPDLALNFAERTAGVAIKEERHGKQNMGRRCQRDPRDFAFIGCEPCTDLGETKSHGQFRSEILPPGRACHGQPYRDRPVLDPRSLGGAGRRCR